jgi:hypothetical protein
VAVCPNKLFLCFRSLFLTLSTPVFSPYTFFNSIHTCLIPLFSPYTFVQPLFLTLSMPNLYLCSVLQPFFSPYTFVQPVFQTKKQISFVCTPALYLCFRSLFLTLSTPALYLCSVLISLFSPYSRQRNRLVLFAHDTS